MGDVHDVKVICRILFDMIPCTGEACEANPHGFACASHKAKGNCPARMLESWGTGFEPEPGSVVVA